MKKTLFTLSFLLLCSLSGNGYLYYKSLKQAPITPIANKEEVKLEVVTKTEPENLEYFLMNRLILQNCDYSSDLAVNYDDYFNTLVQQIHIIADSEFINKAQQKTMAVLMKNKFLETYGHKVDDETCKKAYAFAEYKWKQLNPVTTPEKEVDISNTTVISTPMEAQVNYGGNDKPIQVPLPN